MDLRNEKTRKTPSTERKEELSDKITGYVQSNGTENERLIYQIQQLALNPFASSWTTRSIDFFLSCAIKIRSRTVCPSLSVCIPPVGQARGEDKKKDPISFSKKHKIFDDGISIAKIVQSQQQRRFCI